MFVCEASFELTFPKFVSLRRIVANYFAWRVALHFSDYTNSLYTKLYFEFQRTSEGLRVQEQLWEVKIECDLQESHWS